MGDEKFVRRVLYYLPIFISLLISCNGPNVQHSYIAPETKNIDAWYINLVDENPSDDSLSSINMLREEFGVVGQADYYIKSVKGLLLDEGFIIRDSEMTGAGIIDIAIYGPGMHGEITRFHTLPPIDERNPQPLPPHVIGADIELKKVEDVTDIKIEIKAPDGRFLGKADIAGYKIKATFTAEVIKKLIKKGEY